MMREKRQGWKNFELRVRDALMALGYTVDRDRLIAGTQVDLYAELELELFVHRLVVECKMIAQPVGVEDVRRLYALVNTISAPTRPVFGLLVSSTGFTRTAKQFAEDSGITVKTLLDVASLSFDPSKVVNHTIGWFEQDDLAGTYIDLSCQVTERGQSTVYKPVEEFLDEYFSVTKRPGIAVLGNFGAGKTSLCKHYAYLLSKRWNSEEQPAALLPIYVNLRDFRNLRHLEDDLADVLSTDYHIAITKVGLLGWLRYGKTLLLLDGFDEMASRLDRASINGNLNSLSNFLNRYEVKIILTCRTHFFKSQVDEDALTGLLRLYVRDWGSEELIEYIHKAHPAKASASLETIRSTYNLEELSRTPLFLNMITATIGEYEGATKKSKLYQMYTDRWIESQDYRSILSPEQKRFFMEELAYRMFVNNQKSISHKQLESQVGMTFKLRDYESITGFDEDIRTCTFLVRDAGGRYFFVHKSYLEYFVALRLARQVKEQDLEDFARVELTLEVGDFFAEYFENDWMILVRQLLGNPSEICRTNSAIALNFLRGNKQIYNSLTLALETEKSQKVRRLIVDALARFGRPETVKEILKHADEPGEFGAHCLRALAAFLDHAEVTAKYRETILHERDPQKLEVVLRNVAPSSSELFRDEILFLMRDNKRNHNSSVVQAILHVIPVVSDLDFALASESFLTAHPFSTRQQTTATEVIQNLSARFRQQILVDASSNRRSGLGIGQNRQELDKKYGYLVNYDKKAFGQMLDKVYGISRVEGNR